MYCTCTVFTVGVLSPHHYFVLDSLGIMAPRTLLTVFLLHLLVLYLYFNSPLLLYLYYVCTSSSPRESLLLYHLTHTDYQSSYQSAVPKLPGRYLLDSPPQSIIQTGPPGARQPFYQCCGSASIIMRIWIRDPKNVHMDPDPDADLDPDPRG